MANKKQSKSNTGRGRKPVKQHKSKQRKTVFTSSSVPWKVGVVAASNTNQTKRISGTDFLMVGGTTQFTVPVAATNPNPETPSSKSGDIILKTQVVPSLFERFESEMRTFQRYHIRNLRFEVLLSGGTQVAGMVSSAFFTDADDLTGLTSGQGVLSRIAANGNNYQGNWFRPFSLNVPVTNPTGGFYGTESGEPRLYSPGVFVLAVLIPPSTDVTFAVRVHWDVVFSQPTVEDKTTALTVGLETDVYTVSLSSGVEGMAVEDLPRPVKDQTYVVDIGRYIMVRFLENTTYYDLPVRYLYHHDTISTMLLYVWYDGKWQRAANLGFTCHSKMLVAPAGARLRMVDASKLPPLGADWGFEEPAPAVRYLTKMFLENFQV